MEYTDTVKKRVSAIRWQALGAVVIALGAMAAARLAGAAGSEWTAGALALLIFAVANPVLGVFSESWIGYTARSAAMLLLLHAPVMGAASLVSARSLGEIREDAMVYLAPVLYYPLMVAATGIVRVGLRFSRNRRRTVVPADRRREGPVHDGC